MNDNNINILSKEDASHYWGLSNFRNDYILQNVGNAFLSSYSGLVVTIGTGQGSAYGRHFVNDEEVTFTLPASTTAYLVFEIDLSKPAGSELSVTTKTVLDQDDLANNGILYDIPIYRFVTNATTVTTFTDVRKMYTRESYLKTETLSTAEINTLLKYKFDLGSVGGVKSTQSATGYILLNAVDLNTVTYTGIYYCSLTPQRPTSTNGWMQVFGGGSDTKQVYHLVGTSSQTTYARTLSGGTWSSWKLISGQIQLSTGGYTDGQTISIAANEVSKYSRLRMQVTDSSGATVLGLVDIPLDNGTSAGTTRAGHGTSSASGSTSLITLDVRMAFNTSNITLVMVKQTSISNTGTISTTPRRLGAIWGLPV